MKTNRIFSVLIMVLLVMACDNAKNDVRPVVQVKFETGPNIPFMINPSQWIGAVASDPIFDQNPALGTVEQFSQGKFLSYTPSQTFEEGIDRFKMDVTDPNGVIREIQVEVEVSSNTCNYGPIFDHIQVRKGEQVTIDLLDNDFFCGGPSDITSGGVGSYVVSSDFEDSDFVNLALRTPNDEVSITVTAPQTTGTLKLIYEVGIGVKPEYVGNPASLDLPDGRLNPVAFEKYLISVATIEVID